MSDAHHTPIDPQLAGRFRFGPHDRIASAGSCFAARIATALKARGFNYSMRETGAATENAGPYSARYGEIYTTLQLNQLAQRAIGCLQLSEPAWLADGRYYDPFRPRAVPGGFASVDELVADRQRHLAAVRRLLTESDVFIFTLGLTETWVSRATGAAFPLCPGAGIGRFDPDRHAFLNLDYDATLANLESFLEIAWSLNPRLRVLLTVSPVPLAATMEPQHVVAATMYSKSVLRVVAETARRRHERVDYFAAYEIVTGSFDGSDRFASDRRDVSDEVVARVMESFFKAFTEPNAARAPLPQIEITFDAVASAPPPVRSADDPCDEAYLAGFIART